MDAGCIRLFAILPAQRFRVPLRIHVILDLELHAVVWKPCRVQAPISTTIIDIDAPVSEIAIDRMWCCRSHARAHRDHEQRDHNRFNYILCVHITPHITYRT